MCVWVGVAASSAADLPRLFSSGVPGSRNRPWMQKGLEIQGLAHCSPLLKKVCGGLRRNGPCKFPWPTGLMILPRERSPVIVSDTVVSKRIA